MRRQRYYIYIIISLLLLGVLSFYAWFYHNDISNNVNDWSAFGNFFSGFMMPFLTIANIVVFIELTIVISDYEAKRSVREMEQQQALLIMQFRRQSIESFYQHIHLH
jgi:RsiW-degrading membrane proteinase PrsW (M82 family)